MTLNQGREMTDRQTVYVVTKGSYSAYQIKAVFLDRAEAEAFLLRLNGPEPDFTPSWMDQAEIEEWVDGAYDVPDGYYAAEASTPRDAMDGEIHVNWCNYPDQPANSYSRISYGSGTLIEGYGPSSEHAKRAVIEIARQAIAGQIQPEE